MANTTVVGTLRTLLVADASQFDDALKRSTANAQAWAKDLAAIGTQAATVGQAIADKLTTPLASLGTTASNVTAAVETGLGGMRGALDASHADVQKLGEAFKGVAAVAPAMAGPVKSTTDAVDGLGKAGTKAYEVFHNLGADAPQQIKKVGAAAKQTTSDVGGIVGSFKEVAGTLGVGFAVTKVIGFGKAIVEDAGHVADLSQKLGISAEAVQRFGYAASQTGASMDTVGGAIGKMNKTLSEGDKSTVAVLDQIGLSFRDIRAMKPEDAFATIAQAIQHIPDPMLQAEAATKLFGKTGMELLPAINANLIEIGNSAKVMSDKAVAEFDQLGDDWATLLNDLKVSTAEFMLWSKENAHKYAFGLAGFLAQEGASLVKNTYDVVYGQGAVVAAAATSLTAAVEKKMTPAFENFGLTAKSTAGLLEHYDVVQKQTEKNADALAAAQKKSADAAAAHLAKIKDLAASLSGVGLTQKVNDLNEAVALSALQYGRATLSSKATVEAVQSLAREGAALPPLLMDIYLRHLDWAAAGVKVQVGIKSLLGDLPNYTQQLKNFMAVEMFDPTKMPVSRKIGTGDLLAGMPNLAPAFKTFTEKNLVTPILDTLATDLAAQVPQAIQRAFEGGGDVAKAIGGAIGGTIGKDLGETFAPKISKAIGGTLGKSVGTLFGAAMPIVGELMGAGIGALIDKLTAHAGRDLVKQFAASFGGFDQLHETLSTLGAEGERMWIALTQGVGSNNPQQAQAAIDAITKALKTQTDQLAAQKKALDDARTKVGELQSAVQVFGGVVPAALRPTIAAMLQMSGLPDDLRASLAGLTQDPSWQTMQAKAEELGISLGALGPQFEQAKLGETALGYVRDLHMFEDASADMQGVIVGMSDELSTMYQTAKSTGAALPDTLKPYLQTLVDQGLLLDANGEKVQNLNDVAFKNIEDKSLVAVVDVLKEIKTLLEQGLPKAAEAGAKDIAANFAKNPITVPYTFQQQGGSPSVGPQPQIGLTGGTHGQFVDWGAGTPVTLHGREAVVPYGQSAGAMNITVVSNLDGREVARNQVRFIPDALRRAGI